MIEATVWIIIAFFISLIIFITVIFKGFIDKAFKDSPIMNITRATELESIQIDGLNDRNDTNFDNFVYWNDFYQQEIPFTEIIDST